MTTKELLYLEDALGHQKLFIDQCRETAQKLEDRDLKNYVEQIAAKQTEIYGRLYGLL